MALLGLPKFDLAPQGGSKLPLFFQRASKMDDQKKRRKKGVKKGVRLVASARDAYPAVRHVMACIGPAEQGLARLGPQGAGGLFALRVPRRGL